MRGSSGNEREGHRRIPAEPEPSSARKNCCVYAESISFVEEMRAGSREMMPRSIARWGNGVGKLRRLFEGLVLDIDFFRL